MILEDGSWCEVSCAHCGDVLAFVQTNASANVGPLVRILTVGAAHQTVVCSSCRRGNDVAFRWGRLGYAFSPESGKA